MEREIKLLELNANGKDNVKKARTSARGKRLATAFLLRSERLRDRELILALKNEYTKQQCNYPKTLTGMYGIMVAFEPTRSAAVTRGHNKGLNFGNVATNSESGVTVDVGIGGNIVESKTYCCNCGGDH